jgi:hypothetical protein
VFDSRGRAGEATVAGAVVLDPIVLPYSDPHPAFLETVIEFLKGVHLRHWHQEVAPGIAHQAFHQTLLMGLGGSTEAALK